MIRLFRIVVPTSVLALIVTEAVILLSCYLLTAAAVIEVSPEVFLLYDGGLVRIIVPVVCIMLGLYLNDLYNELKVRNRILLIQQICLTIGVAFLIQALLTYINPEWMLPRTMMLFGSTLALVILPPWRIIYGDAVTRGIGANRILFLGDSRLGRTVGAKVSGDPTLGLACAGYLAAEPTPESDLSCGKWLGAVQDMRNVVHDIRPDRIVVAIEERRGTLPVHDLLDLRLSGIPVEDAATTYESIFGRVCSTELRPSQLIFAADLGAKPHLVTLQSIYSFLIAAVSAVVAAPIMILVAIAVRLTSPGPVFYRQTRVGLGGAPFTLYKFRSMRVDAEAATGAVWASKNDPRVTPVGKWLRLLRLDELPQIHNVLRGEMAIVGPRPERPEFVKVLSEQIPYYRQRHCVKPGITGWAQINYRYGNTMEDTVIKLEYDLYYIKHLSLSLDFYIMFHTAKTMLLSRGAH